MGDALLRGALHLLNGSLQLSDLIIQFNQLEGEKTSSNQKMTRSGQVSLNYNSLLHNYVAYRLFTQDGGKVGLAGRE